MFVIVVAALFCDFGIAVPPAVLQLPEMYLTRSTKPVPLMYFYPDDVSRLMQQNRPRLPLGNRREKIKQIINWIEAIPVEERLNVMSNFGRVAKRAAFQRYLNNWYSKYLLSSFFIDVRLLRLLLRFATWRRRDDEINLRTACDIIEHVQNKYPSSFAYLTPEYVMGWYSVLGSSHSLETRLVPPTTFQGLIDSKIRDDILSDDESKTVFVSLTPAVWSALILSPRSDLLRQTGYES